jgi:hypothetical protein
MGSAKEQIAHQARQSESSAHSDGRADQRQPRAVPQNRLHVVPRAPNECQFRAGVATQCKKLRRRCRCIHLFKLCETGDVRGAYDPHALRLKRAALFRVGEVHRGREQQAILEIRKPCPARRGLVQRYQFFGLRIIERLQHYAAYNAEDRGSPQCQ